MNLPGPIFALFSAALFGISPVLVKLINVASSPILIAGLLYLGSGLGLSIFLLVKKINIIKELKSLPHRHQAKLIGAIISGGILAPICLTYGIQKASAFEVSLLLNFETVMTTLIAAFVFHEHIGTRVWIGKIIIIIGGLLITLGANDGINFSLPAILIILACLFWGIDNNLTRDVDELSPSVLAAVKGLSAGVWNIVLAFVFGASFIDSKTSIAILMIGAICYGVSLVLFVYALRLIGASRTSTYFASGPFIGVIFSLLLLGEQPPAYHWLAFVFMLGGVFVLYREKHSHVHTHKVLTHQHKHTHDEHHQHSHHGVEGSEPDNHMHSHEELTHEHHHFPDSHHRHRH